MSMHMFSPSAQLPSHRKQRGAILFIALIVLVAMSLAGIAMVRSVDTTLGIAGNMAFKQGTIQGSDRGIKAATDWLNANSTGTTLISNNGGVGYYATVQELDWFDLNTWGGGVTLDGGAPDAAGNVVRYIIHRLCTEADTTYNGISPGGQPNSCALSYPASGAASGGSMAVGAPQFEGIPQVHYRITTRVDGPRNTVSVVQVTIIIQV